MLCVWAEVSEEVKCGLGGRGGEREDLGRGGRPERAFKSFSYDSSTFFVSWLRFVEEVSGSWRREVLVSSIEELTEGIVMGSSRMCWVVWGGDWISTYWAREAAQMEVWALLEVLKPRFFPLAKVTEKPVESGQVETFEVEGSEMLISKEEDWEDRVRTPLLRVAL